MQQDDAPDERTPLSEGEIISRLKAATQGTRDPKTDAQASLYVPEHLTVLRRAAPGECNWMLPALGPNVPTVLARAIALEAKKLRDAYSLAVPGQD